MILLLNKQIKQLLIIKSICKNCSIFNSNILLLNKNINNNTKLITNEIKNNNELVIINQENENKLNMKNKLFFNINNTLFKAAFNLVLKLVTIMMKNIQYFYLFIQLSKFLLKMLNKFGQNKIFENFYNKKKLQIFNNNNNNFDNKELLIIKNNNIKLLENINITNNENINYSNNLFQLIKEFVIFIISLFFTKIWNYFTDNFNFELKVEIRNKIMKFNKYKLFILLNMLMLNLVNATTPTFQDDGLCGFIAATNIVTISGYSQWICTTDRITSTDPCASGLIWNGLTCSGGYVDSVVIVNKGLTGIL